MAGLVVVAIPLSAQQFSGESSGLTDSGSLGTNSGQLLQRLGIPEQQLEQLRDQASQGGVENSEMERLCASVAAKHLSADDAGSIGRALGLPSDAVTRLAGCASGGNRLGAESSLNGPAARPTPSGPSSIEERFRELDTPYKLLAPPSLSKLDQFGYDFFSTPASQSPTFDNMPVSSDYVVGPGDELNVLLWGRINRTLKLSVQRDGTLLIPQIGPLPVAGLSFAQAQKLIETQINQIEGVQSDVTMGRLRTIQIFTIGQVAEPGLHAVSALGRVSDALVAAGGVRKTGSLRRVELRRDNRLIRIVDLYAMLLNGDTSSDLRLEPRDVVFVPVIGPVVGLAGDVRNPAIYELRGGETLPSVIQRAGGVSAFGYAHRIQVERIQNHERRVALDVRIDTPEARRFGVDDGDLVKVFTVLPEQQDVVKLEGNVNRPGTYQWEEGMRVVDLIRHGQG
ncbi:MAG: SLBB domain-containing protein, partial [Acidimicrobiales bacterium]